MSTIDEIIGSARLREEIATVCVAGDLAAEHERLDAELRALSERWEPGSLADVDPRRELAERIAAIEDQMRQHEVTFRFRALPGRKFRELRRDNTSDAGIVDIDALVPALIAACAVEPAIPGPERAAELLDVLTQGQADALFDAAWKANTGVADVPKSALASAVTASSAQR